MTDSSLLSFPCEFPIKIVGLTTLEFEATVLSILRKHVPKLGEAAIKQRLSGQGRYLAITATIQATSQAQLDAIYQECSAHPAILMVL